MKYYGDISVEHLEALKELQYIEGLVDNHFKDFPALQLAKGFVCMAHDYYEMEMEEEGDRLILRAETSCPGYFKAAIHVHIENDPLFEVLMEQLKETLALEFIKGLGFNE